MDHQVRLARLVIRGRLDRWVRQVRWVRQALQEHLDRPGQWDLQALPGQWDRLALPGQWDRLAPPVRWDLRDLPGQWDLRDLLGPWDLLARRVSTAILGRQVRQGRQVHQDRLAQMATSMQFYR